MLAGFLELDAAPAVDVARRLERLDDARAVEGLQSLVLVLEAGCLRRIMGDLEDLDVLEVCAGLRRSLAEPGQWRPLLLAGRSWLSRRSTGVIGPSMWWSTQKDGDPDGQAAC